MGFRIMSGLPEDQKYPAPFNPGLTAVRCTQDKETKEKTGREKRRDEQSEGKGLERKRQGLRTRRGDNGEMSGVLYCSRDD